MPAPHKRLRTYDLLARYYDQVMVDHSMLFRRVRRDLLKDVFRRVESVCDLGCGSGEAALEFAARGLKVFAVDLSARQCRTVRAKAREAGLPVRVIRADMRNFRLPHPVDLITCEFDALNHLPRHGSLTPTLRSVARALRPGGWFYFDVNTRRAFEEIWTTTTWVDEKDFKVAIHGDFDPVEMRAELHLDWLLRRGRDWRLQRETIGEVCWTPAQIHAALKQAGFRRVRTVDGAPFFRGWDWDLPGCRTFYLAQKRRGT